MSTLLSNLYDLPRLVSARRLMSYPLNVRKIIFIRFQSGIVGFCDAVATNTLRGDAQ